MIRIILFICPAIQLNFSSISNNGAFSYLNAPFSVNDLNFRLGDLYAKTNRPELSIEYYKKALAAEDFPLDRAPILRNLANVYDMMGNQRTALDCLRS